MRRSPRLTEAVVRGLGVLLVGALAAACGGGPTASPPVTATPSGGHASTTTTTAPTAPVAASECGAARDPLDPTNSGPPVGSPARC